MSEETQPKPQIIEAFHGYSPPFDVAKIVRRMLRDVPPQFLHGLNSIVLTNVAALDFSEVLFHELGHHIHRLHRPEYEGRENVADKWSKKLSTRHLRSRYWYLIPLIVPLSLLFDLGKGIAGKYRSIRAKT